MTLSAEAVGDELIKSENLAIDTNKTANLSPKEMAGKEYASQEDGTQDDGTQESAASAEVHSPARKVDVVNGGFKKSSGETTGTVL